MVHYLSTENYTWSINIQDWKSNYRNVIIGGTAIGPCPSLSKEKSYNNVENVQRCTVNETG